MFYVEKMPLFPSFCTECFNAFFITAVLKEAKNICFLYVGPVSPAAFSLKSHSLLVSCTKALFDLSCTVFRYILSIFTGQVVSL